MYRLAPTNLTGFNTILVAEPTDRPIVRSLPKLSPERAESLLAQLKTQPLCSPRFLVPFPQYAALVANPEFRKQLYRHRTQRLPLDVGLWFEDKIEAFARALSWTLVPLPTTAMALRSQGTSELERVLDSLERESKIIVPAAARCASVRSEEFAGETQIYAFVWPVWEVVPAEWMLLVVLKSQSGSSLPVGTKLQIRDEDQLLVDCSLTPGQLRHQSSDETFLYGQVCGTREEWFQVSVELTGGPTVDLPPLTFSPEVGT